MCPGLGLWLASRFPSLGLACWPTPDLACLRAPLPTTECWHLLGEAWHPLTQLGHLTDAPGRQSSPAEKEDGLHQPPATGPEAARRGWRSSWRGSGPVGGLGGLGLRLLREMSQFLLRAALRRMEAELGDTSDQLEAFSKQRY